MCSGWPETAEVRHSVAVCKCLHVLTISLKKAPSEPLRLRKEGYSNPRSHCAHTHTCAQNLSSKRRSSCVSHLLHCPFSSLHPVISRPTTVSAVSHWRAIFSSALRSWSLNASVKLSTSSDVPPVHHMQTSTNGGRIPSCDCQPTVCVTYI